MTIATVKGAFAGPIATGGSFVVGYPAGKDRGSFLTGVAHRLVAIGKSFSAPEDITLNFGATGVTVTYNGVTTLPMGQSYTMQLDEPGPNPVLDANSGQAIYVAHAVQHLNLGSPGAAAANSIFLSAALTALAGVVTALTGPLATGTPGPFASLDARTGRNVVAAWTGNAVLTVRGFDMYGKPMTEVSAAGTSFTGKKAFKQVSSISVSADVTALTVGTGNAIGLPMFTPNTNNVLKENMNGAAAAAGTFAAALPLTTKPTATTADNRGTYTPNVAPDGSNAYSLLAAVADPTFLGAAQYAA